MHCQSDIQLNIAGTVSNSIVDGPGIRYVVFVQGCPHHCKGCHNKDTWRFEERKIVNIADLYLEIMDDPLLDGVTFSGGEPFCQAKALANLAEMLQRQDLNIWCYTGYEYEELLKRAETDDAIAKLLENINTLVDGPFIESEKSLELQFRGSRNQQILHLMHKKPTS